MTRVMEVNAALLLRFNITQTLQIQLTRLKVCKHSKKEDGFRKCHLCEDSAKIHADATGRLGSRTGKKPFACTLCNYKGSQKIHLHNHIMTHTGEKPFPCTLCNYKSSRRINLNKHILTHTGEKHYNCVFCTKAFNTKADNTRHEKTCRLNPMQNDSSWVDIQKVFKCQVCHFSAAEKYQLKNHVMTHTGEKPFPCNLCNRKFRSRGNLRSHIFTHTREKPHNCQFCTRGFALIAHQKRHERICKLNPKQGDAKWVEEQKKFKCHLCKYRTTTKWSLEEHVKSHTGEKPFNCPLCLYTCSQSSRIHSHLRRIHLSKNGYNCRECDFATLSTSKLLKHATESHSKL